MERRSFPGLFAGAAQHRTNSSEHLAEFIVQLARNVPKRGLLRRNEFLREVAALFVKFREASKELTVAANQIQAGQHNGNESGGEKKVKLALYTVVNLRNACGGLLFAFVILYEQARDCATQSLLARLQRQANLVARLRLICQCELEHAVDGVPELRDRLC